MSKIKINNLKHIKRNEENEILEYISEQNRQMHVALFGISGAGKTEISLSSLKFLGEGDLYSGYTILQYDAAQISENCTNDLFYSSLTYKLIQKSFSNDIDLTRVSKENTFLSYLEKSSYKEDIKTNAKKALIASLSLLPTIGPVIYDLLNVSDDNSNKSYQTVQFVFREYINYLSNSTGIIIFIDNIQHIPLDIVSEFYEIIRQIEGNIILFTSFTLKDNDRLTKKLAADYSLHKNNLILLIENVSLELFDKICEENLNSQLYYKLHQRLQYFYTLVQYVNMREIDELIFQISQNGFENLTDTPTLQGIRALDEIKKDIIDLTSLFPEGIKLSFIKRILKHNEGCTELQFKQSISNLCKMNYILIGDNDTLKIQHEKLVQASKQNLESSSEEERFVELLSSCERVFTEAVYETSDNSEFVFCVNGLLGLEKEISLVKHLGVLEKYINILYNSFRYFQICQVYNRLSDTTSYGNQIAILFPIRAIIQILDSFQKTSNFEKGLIISQELSSYYNMDLYRAKFLLQSYHYEDAIKVLSNRLNNYESWSIYLNALQHLRKDSAVRHYVQKLNNENPDYGDDEYHYIILRNSGHLFDFQTAYENIFKALEYFQSVNNTFVESTCLNNIGILYLYKGLEPSNIQIAKSYFKQAGKIMHQLKSNEEYQSIINMGVGYFCEKDYYMALEYFTNATYVMPQSLTFDFVKLECNKLICQYMTGNLSLEDMQGELLSLYSEAEELPDPWIQLLCKYNLGILRTDSISYIKSMEKEYPGEINVYGLIVPNNEFGDFMLGISPHWRY